MTALTVRNLPPEVARAIREKARKERLSLNKAVVKLLEQATGAVAGQRGPVLHHDLDRFAGTWSREDYETFTGSLQEQRSIEPEMWK